MYFGGKSRRNRREQSWLSSDKLSARLFARPRKLSIEFLEPRALLTATWTPLVNAPPIGTGTMELLTNGSVLMTGNSNDWAILTPNASGSYVDGTWTRVSNADYTRIFDATEVLQDGNVFVAGGEYGTGGDTGEVYDPSTNTWIQLPSQPYGSFLDSASFLMPNGNVLITPVYPSESGYTTIFNTSTNTWSQGPKLYRGSDADEQGFTQLPDGSELTIDGSGTSERYIPSLNEFINDATVPEDLYDALGEIGPGVLLNSGKVIYFGATSTSVIYTPSGSTAPGSWVAGPNIPNGGGCDDAAAVVLCDGTVMVATGPSGTYDGPTTFYIYNPTTNTMTLAPNAPSDSSGSDGSRMLALPDGNALIDVAGTLMEFNPGTATSAIAAADAPTITSIAQNSNGSFLLTGTELNGINAGASYGDDCQMNSNYPLVQLVNGSNVYYATTYDWSNTGVMLGSTSETVDFTLPVGIPAGTYSVYANANGIVSSPMSLTVPTSSDTGPTIATPAAASASIVTGATVNLSVLGADSAGASTLTYNWSVTSSTAGAPLPSFSDNADNTAQNITATFQEAGTYTFTVTITDVAGLSTTSSVTLTVIQTFSSIEMASPTTPASIGGGGTEQFTAQAYDQFGITMVTQPTFAWHLSSGTGSVSSSGLYTASAYGTLATVVASSGAYSAAGTLGVVSSPWSSEDIGSPGDTGTAYDNNGTFTVEGGGSDIWNADDQFHFVYQTLTGNGTIIAEVASLTDTGGWAKVGVMMRNSLSDSDQYALEAITPSNGSTFQYRTTSGADAAGTTGNSGPAVPYWVKLVRSGNTVTGYRSADGVNWTEDGSETISFTNSTIYVGLEVDADDNSALNTSTFVHVALLPGSTGPSIAQAAAASSGTVTGKTVNLSVVGSDPDGETYLSYTWAATSVPSGAASPTYSADNSNAAKNTTAAFSAAGTYTFQVTATNQFGLTATSSVTVVVVQTASGINVVPASLLVLPSQTCQFTAYNADQFGANIPGAISPAWSISPTSGSGTVSSQGLYTAPSTPTTATVTATGGGFTGNSSIQVVVPLDNWTFNAGSGATAVDTGTHGTAGNGTLVGSPTWTTGEVGGAVTLNGSSQSVSTTLGLDSNTVTMSAWIYRTASESSNAGLIFDRNGSGVSGINFYSTTNNIGYTWNAVSSTYNWNSGLTVPLDEWTFVALVVTASNATMYMEPAGSAMQSATNAVANTASNFSGTSYIGQDSLGSRFFAGSIGDVRIYSSSLTAANISSLASVTPTVATPAAASPMTVTGATANLSVLGSDASGALNLTYTWAATTLPGGAASPTFSVNGSNAAQSTTATFSKAGNYTFTVTMVDGQGLTATSSVSVTVNQTPAITVSPNPLSIAANGTQTFTASAVDQFGNSVSLSSLAWSASAGTINASTGAYTAPASHTDVTITATNGPYSGTSAVVVANAAPTVATAAAAGPATVTGTTTSLSVLGADDDPASNLVYTWTATGVPSGAAAPTFSVNGTNAAQNTTATFSAAGSYTLQATITDAGGLATTSSVPVVVSQTLTSTALSPSLSALVSHATQQYTATGYDQFGAVMAAQPTFNWTATIGTISTSGLYTAPYSASSATITAMTGSFTNTSSANITNGGPTVATAAAASPATVTGTTTALSVLGADSDGGGESNLTYTWVASSAPSGAAPPVFSANGTNAAKNSTVTFAAAGSYTFTVTIVDSGGLSTTSTVSVTVSQTATSLVVTPTVSVVTTNSTTQFTATIADQFGTAMSGSITPTWSTTAGTISTSGVFTAPSSPATVTITVTGGGFSDQFAVEVGPEVWTDTSGGSWATAANWQNSVIASGTDSTANFGTLNITGNETVTLDGARTVGNLIFGDTTPSNAWTLSTGTGGPLTLNTSSGSPTITVNNETATISAVVAGTEGLTVNGPGTLDITGTGTWSGTTTVQSGTLEVTAKSGTVPYVVDAGATLMLGYNTGENGSYGEPLTIYGDGASSTTGFYLAGGANYNVGSTLSLVGAPTTIYQYGSGLAKLGEWDTNSGGILSTGAASGSVISANVELYNYGYGLNVTTDVGANTATGDLTIDGPLDVYDYQSATGLMKKGSGSLLLNAAANSGNSGVDITAGTVICGIVNCLGASALVPISSGAVLILDGYSQTIGSLTGAGSVYGGSATASALTVNSGSAQTFSGVLGGAGTNQNNLSLTKAGTATLMLSGLNTYAGDTTINAGTLQFGVTGALPSGTGDGNVDLNGGSSAGILDLNGFSSSIDGLNGTTGTVLGEVVNNSASTAATLTLGNNNATASYAGLIENNTGTGGTLAIAKVGTGTQTLSGSNTYSGGTTVSGGTLLVNNTAGSGTGSGAVTVNSVGTLGGTGTIAGAVSVAGDGTISPGSSGIGTLTVSGAVTLAGTAAMSVNASTGASDVVQGASSIVYGGTLTVTNLAGTFVQGQSFTLFGGSAYSGSFSTINLPALPSGLVWNTTALATTGTIKILGSAAPTIVNPAAASANPVTTSTTTLTALGADNGGESSLTYAWTVTSAPAGAAAVTFSANGTNSAKSTVATFAEAGSYSFLVTITDPSNLSATSSVTVTVVTTLTAINVTPLSADIKLSGTQQLSANALDQFGNALAAQPTFTWAPQSDTGGGGSVSSAGLYTAPSSAATVTVTATSGSVSGTATMQAVSWKDYWKLADGSGTTAADSVGTATGTLSGSQSWTTGIIAGAFAFSGSNYFNVGTSLGSTTSNITVSAWIDLSNVTGSYGILSSSSTSKGWYFGTDAGALEFTTEGKHSFVSASDLTAGVWTNVAVVFTGSVSSYDATFYINGTSIGSPAGSTSAAASSTSNFYVGGGTSSSADFQGKMEEVTFFNAALSATQVALLANSPPTVATAADATPSPITATTVALSVLGADNGGQSNLTYSWAASGPASVAFSTNNSNVAQNTTATFSKAGSYTFTATITDQYGLFTTSSVSVTVSQTVTTIAVSPPSAVVEADATQTYSATAYDQFGVIFSVPPTFTWSSNVGQVSSSGLFTAQAASAVGTVTAAAESVQGSVAVRVDAPPVATPDSYPAIADRTLSVAAPGVLANDTGTSGAALTAVLVGNGPAYGQLALASNGSFQYTPNTDYIGSDSFSYEVFDGYFYSSPVTVAINVGWPAWTGAGGDNHWTTAANWANGLAPQAGDELIFPAGLQLDSYNDFPAGTQFGSITLQAGNIDLEGNGIDLTAPGGTAISSGGNGDVVNVPITLQADATISVTAGSLTLGTIQNGGYTLAVDASAGATVNLTGALEGAGAVDFTGLGTVNTSAASALGGTVTVTSGTYIINGVSGFPSGGTLIIGSTTSDDALAESSPAAASSVEIPLTATSLITTPTVTATVAAPLAPSRTYGTTPVASGVSAVSDVHEALIGPHVATNARKTVVLAHPWVAPWPDMYPLATDAQTPSTWRPKTLSAAAVDAIMAERSR